MGEVGVEKDIKKIQGLCYNMYGVTIRLVKLNALMYL